MTTAVHTEVTQGVLDMAMSILNEELEKMLSVAICLVNRLEPENLRDIRDDEDVIAWRLAQVLEERLSSNEFEDSLRQLLHVKTAKESQAVQANGGAA